MSDTCIIAHRGASNIAPENTGIAFQKAFQIGADGVEFDVHLTSDGEPVVIHDERVDRTTNGIGYVKSLTLSEIKKLDAGSYFHTRYCGEKILTLEEALDLVKNFKIINIEIKNNLLEYNKIEEKVIKIIRDKKMEEKVICSSFNHCSMFKIKKIDPDINTGLLYISLLFQPWKYAQRVGAQAIHPYFISASREIVKRCHDNNVRINVWTVDKEKYIRKMIANKIDCLITNNPEIALSILKEIKKNGNY